MTFPRRFTGGLAEQCGTIEPKDLKQHSVPSPGDQGTVGLGHGEAFAVLRTNGTEL